ncbi:CCA tRNA nucleotidyltransferase [Schaalia sp. lx-100]|uniref:CCA tRNA nucleotidyltransferase n=1 Tax=Schaalia sp. lx-100 TaxID=2899081 RepID=UPI001E30F061|nr:CCA tRNA nucleotidyltransferase [Schaalia sp. lx-100]MCD4557851.1 CCA tRNA nucleotidyltransferase [Schaalia sp. lx-100]
MANATQAFAGIPSHIRELGQVFTEAGAEIALVGGPVRDAFLGKIPHDFDLATNARPERTEEILSRWADATWDVGKEFGTIGARKGRLIVEITTYRTEAYEVGSRKPEVTYGDTLEGDLTRRDFTVNAMAMRLPDMVLVDPHDGLVDLAYGRLRTPVSAEQSFDDDPLRIMRAARFAAQLAIDVDYDVMCAMENMAHRLSIVSAERIRAELERLIISEHPRRGLELMVHTGVADIVLPEVAALRETTDEHRRHKDVYEHTLTVVDQAIALETGADGAVPAPDFILRFAALMHDVGKPDTRRFESDGSVSFHHHEIVGAKMTRKRMKALRFDKATTEAVSSLVALHLRFHGYGESAWTDSAVRRYVTDAGDLLERLHRLTRADCTTRNRRKAQFLSQAYDDLEERIAALREKEALDAIRPDLDGGQVMQILGIRPSKAVKMALDYLLSLRMERGPLGQEAAREELLRWWESEDVREIAAEYQKQQAHWEAQAAAKRARKHSHRSVTQDLSDENTE